MRPILSAALRSIPLVLVLAAFPSETAAQLISLKTVPVAAGDQFLFFPSQNLGMGGVSIALDDMLLDPFVNPAKGGRVGQGEFFSSPTFYSVSQNSGAGRTLPVGTLFSSGTWFGGGVAVLQQIEAGSRFNFGPFPLDVAITVPPPLPPQNVLSEQQSTNKYVQALVGRKIAGGKFAIAASAMLGDLNAIDGVEHLYAGASSIDQYGHIEDYRLGLTGEFAGDRTLEAVIVHNRFSMTHDVTYVDWILTDSLNWGFTPEVRDDSNPDKTQTWGLHLGYVQPIAESGWRVGGILTTNRMQHPKIPNYELQNIPRDPGHTWAYNIGVGISKQEGPTTFGVDLVFEPAVSHTWQEAAGPTLAADSVTIIPDRGKTIENRFNFSNAFVNIGMTRIVDNAAFQLGLGVRSYDYRLRQKDNVAQTRRTQNEQWMEWTPSWGLSFTFSDLELRYIGRATTGTGRPGIAGGFGVFAEDRVTLASGGNILLAPEAALTLQDATVVTHRIGIVLPLR